MQLPYILYVNKAICADCLLRMLLLLLTRDVQFVSDASDLQGIMGSQPVYVLNSFNGTIDKPISYLGGYMDCQQHIIGLSNSFFGAVGNSTFRNCNFRILGRFAQTIENSKFINVTLLMTKEATLISSISGSIFVGSTIDSVQTVSQDLTQVQFVGCRFSFSGLLTSTVNAIFTNVRDCKIQNSFIQADIQGKGLDFVAVFAKQVTDLRLLNSRIISVIVTHNSTVNSTVSGFVGMVDGEFFLQDTDFVINVTLNGSVEYLGGIVSRQLGGNVTLKNVSAYYQNVVGISYSQTSVKSQCIGAVVAFTNQGSLDISCVSIFLETTIASSAANVQLHVGGMVGSLSQPTFSLTDCSIIGDSDVEFRAGYAIYLGGAMGLQDGRGNLSKINYHGQQSLDSYGSSASFGGIIGYQYNVLMEKCHFNGNMSLLAAGNALHYMGGIIGRDTSQRDVSLSYCIATMNISVQTQYSDGGLQVGCIAGISNGIEHTFANCILKVSQSKGTLKNYFISMLIGFAKGKSSFCNAEGSITVTGQTITSYSTSFVAPIAAGTAKSVSFQDVMVHGSIQVPRSLGGVGTAFGNISDATILRGVIAVEVSGQSNIKFANTRLQSSSISGFYVDCERRGNSESESTNYCDEDLTSKLPSRLQTTFSRSSSYNNRYPYLKVLPIYTGDKYIISETGAFRTEYKIDSNGLPFPLSDNIICKGACYGSFSSPASYKCTDGNQYCVSAENANEDFPDKSCLQSNAVCRKGTSLCKPFAELIENDKTHSCLAECEGCSNGHCLSSKCICDVYYAGDKCESYKCNADSPVCYGDETEQCSLDNQQCIFATGCATIACMHGECVEDPDPRCVCDDLWSGSNCSVCKQYGPSCDLTQQQCDQLCKGHGTCNTIQTTICTCDKGFNGTDCSTCAANYFLANCSTADVCGRSVCSGKGKCTGDSQKPACACYNNWEGEKCDVCNAFGTSCELTPAQCAEECCMGIEPCNWQCVGGKDKYSCECKKGQFGGDCNISAAECDTTYCSSHGKCVGGVNIGCTCSGLWTGDQCQTCNGFGISCNLTTATCSSEYCHQHGTCTGPWDAPVCECIGNFNSSTDCEICNSGMADVNGTCICGESQSVCNADQFCSNGACLSSCKVIQHCQICSSPNFATCSGCYNGMQPDATGMKCVCGGIECGQNQYCDRGQCKNTCAAITNCTECLNQSLGLCGACAFGLRPNADNTACICSVAQPQCGPGHYCSGGTCAEDCTLLDVNCQSCVKSDSRACAACKSGFSLKEGLCEAEAKGGPPITIIAGACAGAAVLIVIVTVLIVKLKGKKSAIGKSTKVIRDEARTDSSLKDTPPPVDVVLHQPKPIKALELQDNGGKRRVKKLIIKRDEGLLEQQPDYTGELSRIRRGGKLEPIKQSGKEQFI